MQCFCFVIGIYIYIYFCPAQEPVLQDPSLTSPHGMFHRIGSCAKWDTCETRVCACVCVFFYIFSQVCPRNANRLKCCRTQTKKKKKRRKRKREREERGKKNSRVFFILSIPASFFFTRSLTHDTHQLSTRAQVDWLTGRTETKRKN